MDERDMDPDEGRELFRHSGKSLISNYFRCCNVIDGSDKAL